MQKVDRLGWADGICFQSYGVKVGIRVNDSEALERVPSCLPPGWEPAQGPFVDILYSMRRGGRRAGGKIRDFHLLYCDAVLIARTLEFDEVYEGLESDVPLSVGEFAPDRVFVHAGVVAWQGKALLLPGQSHSGKSTLVAELLRAGATYYSDEYAVLDAAGQVHPFPRKLSLRQPNGQPNQRCSPEQLGSQAGTQPLPVAMVAAVTYQPGARWQPRPLSPGKAMMELMGRTLPAKIDPDRSLATLQKVVERARTVKGVRGEAGETVKTLLRELS